MNLELLKKRSSIFRSIVFVLALVISLRFFSYSIFPPKIKRFDRIGRVFLYPHRGVIRDINGIVLVNNDIAYDVYVDVGGISLKQKNEILEKLESQFPLSKRLKERVLSSNRGTFLVRSGIALRQAKAIAGYGFKNVVLIPSDKRVLLYPSLSKIIGRTSSSYGISGLEKKYDVILSPKIKGELLYARHGKYKLYGDTLEEKPAVNGGTVYTTIDVNIQRMAEDILKATVDKYKGAGGEIVVMDTKNGGIRAMASTGSIGSVIGDIFEPGSSIKPVTVSIGLETRSVKATDTFYSKGYIRPSPLSRVIIHDIDKYGTVTVADAVRVSCNVGIVNVAKKIVDNIGEEGFYKYLHAFGFGNFTGVDLEGESRGILRPPSKWSAVDYAEIAIGQGIGVTALQLLDAISTIANGGVMVKPHIVDRIVLPDGSERYIETKKRRIISEDTAIAVKKMLRSVVTNGTGIRASVPGIEVAGKTGTAQKPSPQGGYFKNKYYSIFVGFYPFDTPKYSIIIVVDDPKGKYYGADVAAPAFREMVERIVSYERGNRFALTGDIAPVNMINVMNSSGESYLPDLRGKTLKDVFVRYEQWKKKYPGMQLKIEGYGKVVIQKPNPGTLLSKIMTLSIKMKP